MTEIQTYSFNPKGIETLRNHKYGSNWPVVYVIENGTELYVGETIRVYGRARAHLDNPERQKLKKIHVISDDEFNKSATLDTESSLIEYLVADGKYKLQNGNGGLQNHDYFDRANYQAKFDVLWTKLQKMGIAQKDLLQIRNSDLFKYSPYKTLTDDQYIIATKLLEHLKNDYEQTYIIHGGPGTGKTILATFLIKQLVEQGDKKVALVIAMSSLRQTLKKVFAGIPGLNSKMVIGPADVVKDKYDVLIVDEAHRLRRRRNIPNYGSYDKVNKKLGLDKEADELDWIRKTTKQIVLFFDEKQSVRPSDVPAHKILDGAPIEFALETQMRVKGGDAYLKFVDDLWEVNNVKANFSNYDFRVFESLGDMVTTIKEKNTKHGLCRMVGGESFKWVSHKDKTKPDIVIGGQKLFWNSRLYDWVNSPSAINEVGCIHTIQGYDLNYTGVIIGSEIGYDPTTNTITINRDNFTDVNGKKGVTDNNELKRYILNRYKTLMTRGILGTYVYVVDDNLRSYFKKALKRV